MQYISWKALIGNHCPAFQSFPTPECFIPGVSVSKWSNSCTSWEAAMVWEENDKTTPFLLLCKQSSTDASMSFPWVLYDES